jgi:hypothetical protein
VEAGDGGPGEASVDASEAGISCGPTQCYAGQTCVSGACTFPCTGARVPGDYPTVQAAVDALSAASGGTICLAARTFDEGVTVAGSTPPLTFQGVSPDQTTVTNFFVQAHGATLAFSGLATQQIYVQGTSGTVTVSSSWLTGAALVPGFWIDSTTDTLAVTLDGVDAAGDPGGAPAIQVGESSSTVALTLTVQNSYVHHAQDGVSFDWRSERGTHVILDNDTFENDGTAIHLPSTGSSTFALEYFNDLVVGNSVGIDVGSTTAQFGDNALFANHSDYGGGAGDGPGYVKTDPLLDKSTTPPRLLPGSPCRAAGSAAHAPATDFWGNPRTGGVDIGAVQSP